MSQIDAHIAQIRDKVCRRLRYFLHERDFVEIHSPILLLPLNGTEGVRVNIQEEGYELRSCMELKLRSALAAGLGAVFELGPCFRPGDQPTNKHHPEFYMLELFRRELDYGGLLGLTKELMSIAFENPDLEFDYIDVTDWLTRTFGIDIDQEGFSIRSQLVDRNIVPSEFAELPEFHAINHVVAEYLEKGCGTKLRPAVMHRYPTCTVCLANRDRHYPYIIERFEIFINGLEVAHGFVDEMCAENVLTRMKESGKQFTDEAFVALLQTGSLPPTAGVGFGIERLLMAIYEMHTVSNLLHENQFERFQICDLA